MTMIPAYHYKHSNPIYDSNKKPVAQRVHKNMEPNYKQMAYADTRKYGEKLTGNNDLDEVVKGYLQGQVE